MLEPVGYEHASAQRTLPALVDRLAPTQFGQGAAPVLHATLLVDADPAAGVASPAGIDKGADRVSVPERRGGTPAWRIVERVEDAGDPDLIRLVLR